MLLGQSGFGRGFARVLPMLVCIVAASVMGGEKVRFSDDQGSGSDQNTGTQRGSRLMNDPWGGLRSSSRGSMEGVAAAPFSFSTPGRSLTPQDRELLDQKKNWMFQTSEDFGLTDKSANRAFGVREADAESGPSTGVFSSSSHSDSMSRFLTSSRQAAPSTTSAPLKSSLDEPSFSDLGAPGSLPGESLLNATSGPNVSSRPDLSQSLSDGRQRTGGLGVFESLSGVGNAATPFSRGLDRPLAGSSGLAERSQIGTGLFSAPVMDPLSGSLGSIGEALDPTSRPLNPILPSGPAASMATTIPGFSDFSSTLAAPNAPSRSRLADTFRQSSFSAPGVGFGVRPNRESPSIRNATAVLPMPRRAF